MLASLVVEAQRIVRQAAPPSISKKCESVTYWLAQNGDASIQKFRPESSGLTTIGELLIRGSTPEGQCPVSKGLAFASAEYFYRADELYASQIILEVTVWQCGGAMCSCGAERQKWGTFLMTRAQSKSIEPSGKVCDCQSSLTLQGRR